jgi:hypothetical protein
VGSGEGIQLPGESGRYRLLAFTCPQCEAKAYRIHFDERELLCCSPNHGVMVLDR